MRIDCGTAAPLSLLFLLLFGHSALSSNAQEERHRCCPVRATGGSLPCTGCLLAPLAGNKEGSKAAMVRRVRTTLYRFPANILLSSVDNTPLRSMPSGGCPLGGRFHLTCITAQLAQRRLRWFSHASRHPECGLIRDILLPTPPCITQKSLPGL